VVDVKHKEIRDLVNIAGLSLLKNFRKVEAQLKSDGSYVTIADKHSEDILVKGLKHLYPTSNIISEEGGNVINQNSEWTWFVDPLDGTSAFMEGLAHWGISLGLHNGDDFVYGITHFPRLSETYYSKKGGPLIKNNQQISTTQTTITQNSVLYAPSTLHKYAHIRWPGKIRNLGSISAHLSLVSGGSAAAAVIPVGWKNWDIGAGLVFAQSAGLLLYTNKGRPFNLSKNQNSSFVVGNKHVMEWFLKPESVLFY